MSYCYYCFQPKEEGLTWSNFLVEENKFLCQNCYTQLEWIGGKRCIGCSKIVNETTYCKDCEEWKLRGHIVQNTSFLKYNEFMKQFFIKYKFRGDYELARVLAALLRKEWNIVEKEKIICPIPLSAERLQERGFNQVTAVLDFLGFPYVECLARDSSEKQSKKSNYERKHSMNPFRVTNNVKGKEVVIVDDIYTTGSTIYYASKVLKESGVSKVFSMTFIRA